MLAIFKSIVESCDLKFDEFAEFFDAAHPGSFVGGVTFIEADRRSTNPFANYDWFTREAYSHSTPATMINVWMRTPEEKTRFKNYLASAGYASHQSLSFGQIEIKPNRRTFVVHENVLHVVSLSHETVIPLNHNLLNNNTVFEKGILTRYGENYRHFVVFANFNKLSFWLAAALLFHKLKISWERFVDVVKGDDYEENLEMHSESTEELDEFITGLRQQFFKAFFTQREVMSQVVPRIEKPELKYGTSTVSLLDIPSAERFLDASAHPDGFKIYDAGGRVNPVPFFPMEYELHSPPYSPDSPHEEDEDDTVERKTELPPNNRFQFQFPPDWIQAPKVESRSPLDLATLKTHGACFNFSSLQNSNIERFLDANIYENIVIKDSTKRALCFTRTQVSQQLSNFTGITIPCAPVENYRVDPDTKFYRIDLSDYSTFVPRLDLIQMIEDASTQIFEVQPSTLQLESTSSLSYYHNSQMVSADHCQGGTQKSISRIVALEFLNKEHEASYRVNVERHWQKVMKDYQRLREQGRAENIGDVLRIERESANSGPRRSARKPTSKFAVKKHNPNPY